MAPIDSESHEVLVARDEVVVLARDDVADLKERASSSPRKRSRICAHGDTSDPLHEMLIALDRETYIRPHKHEGKSESFHLVDGSVDVVIFDDQGCVEEVVSMGDYRSGRSFYYRLNVSAFHTVIVKSDVAVLHETTNGPFDRSDTLDATWAPPEQDLPGRQAFARSLDDEVLRWAAARNPRGGVAGG